MKFSEKHISEVIEISKKLDCKIIEDMAEILANVKTDNGRLFILGVGGSAGNASHAVNDFRKLANLESYAPTDNISEITARTNDEGWNSVFKGYLEVSKLNSKDCLLILSVGGGDQLRNVSVNICEAIEFAKKCGTKILGIVGRSNGYTSRNSDLCLVIPEVNPKNVTPHSESFQAIIWHLLVSHPKLKTSETKW